MYVLHRDRIERQALAIGYPVDQAWDEFDAALTNMPTAGPALSAEDRQLREVLGVGRV